MKILHTSDWHLGHELYQYNRQEEHLYFFEQLIKIIKNEKPDVMLICGDIYHTATPSNNTMKFFTDNMIKIHDSLPEMKIIVTAGNHDSCARLESTSSIWQRENVFIVGNLERNNEKINFDKHIIEIINKGYILAVPHIYGQQNLTIFKDLQEEISHKNCNNLPIIMMAHIAITGSDFTGHETQIIGGMESENINIFGDYYDYLALGHIHCPQTIKNSNNKARYSGSPIRINFDENYKHSVSIVEIDKHGDSPKIKTIDIDNKIDFYTIPQQATYFEQAIEELEKFNPHQECYLKFNILVKDFAPNYAEVQIMKILENKPQIKFCSIKIEREYEEEKNQNLYYITQEIKEIQPIDLAKKYYKSKYGQEMDEKMTSIFEEIIASLKASNNE